MPPHAGGFRLSERGRDFRDPAEDRARQLSDRIGGQAYFGAREKGQIIEEQRPRDDAAGCVDAQVGEQLAAAAGVIAGPTSRPRTTTTRKEKVLIPSVETLASTVRRATCLRSLKTKPATRTAAVILTGSRRPSRPRGQDHCRVTETARRPWRRERAQGSPRPFSRGRAQIERG